MGAPIIIGLLVIGGIIGTSWLIWRNTKAAAQHERESSSFAHEAQGYQSISRKYHVPRNNHDHLKYMHSSQESAEAEVRRMKRGGYEGSERLNAYHNPERGGWYVGRGSW
jgi:hypothetical protein